MNTAENNDNNNSLDVKDMLEQIRMQEADDQDGEHTSDENMEEGLIRPDIGVQPDMEEPENRKQYVPIRNRPAYRQLLRETAKAIAFLEHVTNKRGLYDVKDEAAALESVSVHAYRALTYVQDKLKENEDRKRSPNNPSPDNDKNKERGTRHKHGRQVPVRAMRKQGDMSLD